MSRETRRVKRTIAIFVTLCMVLSMFMQTTVLAASSDDAFVTGGLQEITPTSANLTEEGNLDWAHFNKSNSEGFQNYARKDIPTALITGVTTLGEPDGVANDTTTNFVYSDAKGTPDSPENNHKGTILRGEGNGITFYVPASLESKRLNLYIGSWAADLTVEVTINGNLEYMVETGTPNTSGPAKWELLSLEYRTNSLTDEVKVKLYAPKVYIASGCVNLSAVTLGGNMESSPNPGEETMDQLCVLYHAAIHAGRLEDDYTQASWAAYQEAVMDAKEVLETDTATPEQIRRAYSALQAGIDGLKPLSLDPLTAMQALTYTDEDGTVLPYRFYVPEDYDPDQAYPVLLFFHGAGERGTDNQAQIVGGSGRELFKRLLGKEREEYKAILIAPQCPNTDQWVNTPWSEGSYQQDEVALSRMLKAALSLLAEVESQYHVDANRRYVMGVSMGGFGTWDAITRNPDLFAAAIPICGSADPSKAELIKDMPVWTFHGDADPTVPVSGTREMVAALRAVGSSVRYTEYAGYGHNVWDSAFAEPELLSWMFSQSKVDTSELHALYEANKDRTNDGYTEESWNQFQTVLAKAKALLEEETASQDEVDALVSELGKAIDDLEKSEPTEEKVVIRYNGRNASLAVNGEEQTIADLLGVYTAPATEEALTLEFTPVQGREFAGVQVNGVDVEESAFETDSYVVEIPAEDAAKGLENTYTFTVVDKQNLRAAIEIAEGRANEAAEAVESVQEKYEAALQAAKDVEAKKTATQDEINTAWSDLIDALHYLSFVAGDKSQLDIPMEIAETINRDLFTPDSLKALDEAYAAAEDLLDDEEVLEADITAAVDALYDAIYGLVYRADVTELEALVNKGDGIVENADQYIQNDAWTSFETVLAEAKTVLEDANATQDAVDTAAEDLAAAISALRLIPDKDALEALIGEAEAINTNKYTAKSVATMKAALSTAKAVLNDAEATEEEVADAVEALESSIDGLVEKSTSTSSKNSGSTSANVGNAYGAAGVVSASQSVAANAYVVSDTTVNFTLKRGSAYCFKMTVVNGNAMTPGFTVGNGDVLKTQFVAKVGNDYYYRVYATGTPGQSTGVYTTLPGNAAVKHCTVTIG